MSDTTSNSTMTGILAEIRTAASTAASFASLQQSVVEVLSQKLSYYSWTGFYMRDPNDAEMLVLGPFVGAPTPHVRIPVTLGICGAAVASGETVIVDDVNADPRYLSCSIETRSEIVIPIYARGKVIGEIDIDSHDPAAFTGDDQRLLEEVAQIIGTFVETHGTEL